MKKLVVFYSLEGSTRFIAETIARTIGADTLELKQKKDLTTKGFKKYFLGGMQVILKKEPELHALDKDPAAYDVLYFGTPVWAGNFVPALRTFFKTQPLKGKKVALFCCCDGGKGKSLREMRRFLAGNDVIGEKEFLRVSKNRSSSETSAEEWAKETLARLG